jgi:hypothetical protein
MRLLLVFKTDGEAGAFCAPPPLFCWMGTHIDTQQMYNEKSKCCPALILLQSGGVRGFNSDFRLVPRLCNAFYNLLTWYVLFV